MNFYKISEEQLIDLVARSLKLSALESDGVDNWSWYGESFGEIIKEYGGDEAESFGDAAKEVIKVTFEKI